MTSHRRRAEQRPRSMKPRRAFPLVCGVGHGSADTKAGARTQPRQPSHDGTASTGHPQCLPTTARPAEGVQECTRASGDGCIRSSCRHAQGAQGSMPDAAAASSWCGRHCSCVHGSFSGAAQRDGDRVLWPRAGPVRGAELRSSPVAARTAGTLTASDKACSMHDIVATATPRR